MIVETDHIRDVAIVGHQGSGKTTLLESLAYKSQAIPRKGSVEKGNTVSDFLPVEKKKQLSVSSSIVPLSYEGYKINLIDVPGNDDFLFETIGITRMVKGAILVIDATKGIQSGTLKAFRLLKKRGVPMFLYLNKMDHPGISFDALYDEIREKIDNKKCVPFCLPIGHGGNFDGFVNVPELKARKYDGKDCVDDVIYEDKRASVFALHNRLCEAVALTDDALLERFFNGESLTQDEIRKGLRQGVLAGELYPILVGSALKDIGTQTLLKMLIDYLPSPSDLKPMLASTPSGDVLEVKTESQGEKSLVVLENRVSPYQGVLSYFKVLSGVIRFGDELVDEKGKTYRVTSLFEPFGESLKPIQEIGAGDIGATNRFEGVKLGETLSSPKNPFFFPPVSFPTPTYFLGIVPETKNDSDKLFVTMNRLMLEDPTLALTKNESTGQIVLGGLTKTHLSFLTEKLEDFGIRFHLEPLKIPYRETITKKGSGEGRYIKQSGGSGYYGVVDMTFEPAKETSFSSTVFGGHIDKGYFPAVEKGFLSALEHGPLLKAPVVGVKATLTDGKQHPVDSNEKAFSEAARICFEETAKSCGPILLEPYEEMKVNLPAEFLGPVLSDLAKRRCRILSTEEKEPGTLEIVADVPLSEILEYANEIKGLTRGSGFFNEHFLDYEPVPENKAKEILSAANS